MNTTSRRSFLKSLGYGGAALLAANSGIALAQEEDPEGGLVDPLSGLLNDPPQVEGCFVCPPGGSAASSSGNLGLSQAQKDAFALSDNVFDLVADISFGAGGFGCIFWETGAGALLCGFGIGGGLGFSFGSFVLGALASDPPQSDYARVARVHGALKLPPSWPQQARAFVHDSYAASSLLFGLLNAIERGQGAFKENDRLWIFVHEFTAQGIWQELRALLPAIPRHVGEVSQFLSQQAEDRPIEAQDWPAILAGVESELQKPDWTNRGFDEAVIEEARRRLPQSAPNFVVGRRPSALLAEASQRLQAAIDRLLAVMPG